MAGDLIGFVQKHPGLAASALGGMLTAASALAGAVMRKALKSVQQAFETLNQIKQIQTEQAANHLSHIEAHTSEMRDAQKETNAKLDVLISVIEKKL